MSWLWEAGLLVGVGVQLLFVGLALSDQATLLRVALAILGGARPLLASWRCSGEQGRRCPAARLPGSAGLGVSGWAAVTTGVAAAVVLLLALALGVAAAAWDDTQPPVLVGAMLVLAVLAALAAVVRLGMPP
jgi:hypothetical protein